VHENIPFKTVYAGPSTYAGTIVEIVVHKAGLTEPPANFYLAEVHPSGGTRAAQSHTHTSSHANSVKGAGSRIPSFSPCIWPC
jgi:hypothetical protein